MAVFVKGFLKENKAQAAAPFELFVAVIIMTFVVIVGYQALERVNNEVCLNTVDREMTEFKTAIESTVNLKSSMSIIFRPDESCFVSGASKGKEYASSMKIELEDNPNVCSAACNYPSDKCHIMTFSNPNVAGAFRRKCLELPSYTQFLKESCQATELQASSGYSPIDPTVEGIKIGRYDFRNISPAGDTYPKICVYWKAG